jgi:hypothetical protein
MFPVQIPDHITRDKGRSAELRVYEILSEQLSDKFVCYYSRPWHQFTPDGHEKDGEADFVVAHPDLGMLVIEVKGGRVSCRERDEQWLSKDRYGIEYKIKNPVAQARTSKHNLLRMIKESRDWRPRFIRICHGVILPDNTRPQRPMGADAPLGIFAFGSDLGQLGDWVAERLGRTDDGDGIGGLGQDGMAALHTLLSTRFELRPHLARALSDDIRHIERLTAEQFWVLDALDENAQMSISCATGTGKTLLALEKALRTADEGKRTLLVCFNNALAAYLKKLAGDQENLVVASFHGLCGSMARLAGHEVPKNQSVDFYNRILPESLFSAVDAKPELRFDAIIIDEGQDFTDDWLDTLRLADDHGQFRAVCRLGRRGVRIVQLIDEIFDFPLYTVEPGHDIRIRHLLYQCDNLHRTILSACGIHEIILNEPSPSRPETLGEVGEGRRRCIISYIPSQSRYSP